MMSSVSEGVLACLLDDVRRRHRFAFPRFAPRRLVFPPRLFVSRDGDPTGLGLLACLVMLLPTVRRWRGHDLDVERVAWSIVMPRSFLLLYCFE